MSSTPKAANGAASTPKSAAASVVKASKAKPAKAKEGADKKEAPKEAKMTPEQRHSRKEVFAAARLLPPPLTRLCRRRCSISATSSSEAS